MDDPGNETDAPTPEGRPKSVSLDEIRTKTEVDWDNLPDEFTLKYCDDLTVGQMLRIEQDADNRLTELQRESYMAAVKERFPGGSAIGAATARLIPKITVPDGWFRARHNLDAKFDKFAKESKAQGEALERLSALEMVSPLDTDSMQVAIDAGTKSRKQEVKRQQAMLDLTRAIAASTSVLQERTEQQAIESGRLAVLTWLLSWAVIFDIMHSSFDNHTRGSALISIAVATVVTYGAIHIGSWRHRRKSGG